MIDLSPEQSRSPNPYPLRTPTAILDASVGIDPSITIEIPAQVSIFVAADILGVPTCAIHRAIRRGLLTGTRPHRRGPCRYWMIDTESLNAVDVSVEYHLTAVTDATRPANAINHQD
jgi:hypothetical protein